MATSIVVNNLSKVYEGSQTPALNKLTLRVAAGEVYGFLGANGAGKSTTIRLLLNFIQPTGGSAQIMGKDIVAQTVDVRKQVGYLAGDVALWPKVTGNEMFAYLMKLQFPDQAGDRLRLKTEYLEELIQRFEAEPEKRIDTLSKGNRQKIGVIQALMHEPDVLILDEPTSGLDPLMQEVFYDEIRRAAKRGAAVFVSSHNLAETQRMCDRVGIIKHGKLIHEQDIQDDTSFGAPVFRVVFRDEKQSIKLDHSPSLKIISREGPTLQIQPTGSIAAALKILSAYDIAGFTTQQLNLEDEFLEYYGDGA